MSPSCLLLVDRVCNIAATTPLQTTFGTLPVAAEHGVVVIATFPASSAAHLRCWFPIVWATLSFLLMHVRSFVFLANPQAVGASILFSRGPLPPATERCR